MKPGPKAVIITRFGKPRSIRRSSTNITVGALMLQNAEGVRVPLQKLAEIYETSGRYSIAHEGTRRRQAVFCNVEGRDLA